MTDTPITDANKARTAAANEARRVNPQNACKSRAQVVFETQETLEAWEALDPRERGRLIAQALK